MENNEKLIQTGLNTAKEYLLKKNKNISDFNLEFVRIEENTNQLVINAIHKQDLESITPGKGLSLQLYFDPAKNEIVKQLKFQ